MRFSTAYAPDGGWGSTEVDMHILCGRRGAPRGSRVGGLGFAETRADRIPEGMTKTRKQRERFANDPFLYTHTRARAYAQRYSPTCLLAHASFRPSLRAHSDYPKDGLRPSGARVGGEAEDARLTRAS